MNTERPVRMNTHTPVTLCSLQITTTRGKNRSYALFYLLYLHEMRCLRLVKNSVTRSLNINGGDVTGKSVFSPRKALHCLAPPEFVGSACS